MRRSIATLLASILVSTSHAGCSSESQQRDLARGTPAGAGSFVGPSAAGASSKGTAGADLNFGGNPVPIPVPPPVNAAGASAGVAGMASIMDVDNQCAASTVRAEQVVVEEEVTVEETVTSKAPVAFYIMLDQSSSMLLIWPGAVDAIKGFINDQQSAGNDIAVQYFPLATGQCDGSTYSQPDVMLGRLPDHAANIAQSLDSHMPGGAGVGTPTEGALRGATKFCQDFAASHQDEKCVVVLVTDGNPSQCSFDFTALGQVAADAAAQGVKTFAVGLSGSDFQLLDVIATNGGGEDCDPGPTYACDVTADSSRLIDALNKIRESVRTTTTRTELVTKTVETPVACEWMIPEPPQGEQFDRNKVNVRFSATNIPDVMLGKVETSAQCRENGWHYDNADAPSRIIACPQTCQSIQAVSGAKVDVLLGCVTVPLL